MRWTQILGLALFGAVATPRLASANDRFPQARRVLEHPGDANRLYLAATYGRRPLRSHIPRTDANVLPFDGTSPPVR